MAGAPDFQGMFNQINFDYNKAVSAANGLSSVADDLVKSLSSLKSGSENIGAVWTGTHASRYRQKLMQQTADLEKLISQINAAAKGISDTARVYMQAEQSRVQAQMRDYQNSQKT